LGISKIDETTGMKLIITDTNIFFDIISIGALPEFFSLDYEICTTVFVIEEIKRSDQREAIEVFIRAKEINVIDFSAEEIGEIYGFNTEKNFKGITDKSVLWKSVQIGCPLLTGDRKLRKEAETQGVEVHGSIWVITSLVENGLIDRKKGIKLLESLKEVNSSLPVDEIDKLIREYKK
jgi:rRNA-processing protein FCF1